MHNGPQVFKPDLKDGRNLINIIPTIDANGTFGPRKNFSPHPGSLVPDASALITAIRHPKLLLSVVMQQGQLVCGMPWTLLDDCWYSQFLY